MSTVEEVYEGDIKRKVTRRTSFKIEETSSTTKTSTMTTAAKLYGKGLEEYEEMDVDQLLSQLTAEEISMLVKEVDPDDSLLPPSQRCSYECAKSPTGPLDRKKLIEHINKQAMETPDQPELKPYVPGTVRGKKWIPPPPPQKQRDAEEQIAIDLGDEYDTALSGASQEEIIDLAAILGFHSMMNQDQYHASLLNKGQPVGLGWDGITKATQPKAYPQEPPNDTDVDKTLQQVKDDDHELLTLNWNNIRNISDEKYNDLFMALRENTHLETLSLTNVGLVDRHALKLIEAVEKNSTLKVLNVETNFLSPQIVLRLIKAMLVTKSLEEFRGANQRCQVLGNKIEMEITNLIEQNPTILRLGLHLEYNDARQRVSNHLQRNIDRNHHLHHHQRPFTFSSGNRPLDHRVHKDCYDHADEFYAHLAEVEEEREHERLFPTDAPIKPREHKIVEHPTNMKPPSPTPEDGGQEAPSSTPEDGGIKTPSPTPEDGGSAREDAVSIDE